MTTHIEKHREKLVGIGPSFFKTFEIHTKFLGYQRTQPDESFPKFEILTRLFSKNRLKEKFFLVRGA
jgi:hypothetical protein